MRTRGDMLRFAVAFALRRARKLVRGLRNELDEAERFRVVDDVVHQLNSMATPGGSKTICRRQARGTPHDDECADGVGFGLVFGGRHNGDTDRNPAVS